MEATPTIKRGLDLFQKAEKCVREARQTSGEVLTLLEEMVAKAVGLTYVSLDWTWDCPESPTDHCVYNPRLDPAYDDCIFCHQPEERK